MASFSSVTGWAETTENNLGESVLIKKIAKIKISGSNIGPGGKKLMNFFFKLIIFFFTGSIIGPAMAGPTGSFATALGATILTNGIEFSIHKLG